MGAKTRAGVQDYFSLKVADLNGNWSGWQSFNQNYPTYVNFREKKYLGNMQTEWRTDFNRRAAEMWTPLKRLLWSVQRPGTATLLKMWNEIARLNVSVRNAQSNSIKMNT